MSLDIQASHSAVRQALPPTVPEAARGAVIAPLTYLADSAIAPVYDKTRGGVREGNYAARAVTIGDGRARARDLSLDREGFAFARHETAVRDFGDPEAVRRDYYPEMARLVKDATGAARVLVFDHNVRIDGGAPGRDQPVRMVHNDYTAASGLRRARELLGDEAAAALAGKRLAIVNVWRPLKGPVKTAPLALADAGSIAPEDLVPVALVYAERTGEIYYATHNPAHRWFAFPDMAAEEAILIKGYDSAEDGRARFTLHTAFDDPTSPADAPPRESIEVRTLAIFED